MLIWILKILLGVAALISLAAIIFFALCLIPEGDGKETKQQ